MVMLWVTMDSFETTAHFYVIDIDASYRALLGRPWLHELLVVPSTLHQCLKYINDEKEHRIFGEREPFTCFEIHMPDARYYDVVEAPSSEEPKADSNKEPICRVSKSKAKDNVVATGQTLMLPRVIQLQQNKLDV